MGATTQKGKLIFYFKNHTMTGGHIAPLDCDPEALLKSSKAATVAILDAEFCSPETIKAHEDFVKKSHEAVKHFGVVKKK